MPRGELIYRCEHNDWDFLPGRGALVDGVLIAARYLAPYPDGHPSEGKQPRRLEEAAHAIGREPAIDPDTAALGAKAVTQSGAARLRLIPGAQGIELPLDLNELSDRRRFDSFVDDVLQGQPGVGNDIAAPYVDYGSPKGIAYGLNVRMLERTVRTVGPERAVGFLQGTRHRLLRGDLARFASRVAATQVRRSFIRVRDLKAEEAPVNDVLAYVGVIEALDRRGVEAVPDCVGRLGPFLIAMKAYAFSTGSHNFRSVPQALLSVRDKDPDDKSGSGGGGTSRPVTYELEEGGEVPREKAPEMPADFGRSAPTGVKLKKPRDLDRYRARRLYVLRQAAQSAMADPEGFLRGKQSSNALHERAWAAALLERLRRTA